MYIFGMVIINNSTYRFYADENESLEFIYGIWELGIELSKLVDSMAFLTNCAYNIQEQQGLNADFSKIFHRSMITRVACNISGFGNPSIAICQLIAVSQSLTFLRLYVLRTFWHTNAICVVYSNLKDSSRPKRWH